MQRLRHKNSPSWLLLRGGGVGRKHSPTNDLPEERRHQKKTYRTKNNCALYITSEQYNSDSSESDRDHDLHKGTNQEITNMKTVLMTMRNQSNFSVFLQDALVFVTYGKNIIKSDDDNDDDDDCYCYY